jgi:hypothetical protein
VIVSPWAIMGTSNNALNVFHQKIPLSPERVWNTVIVALCNYFAVLIAAKQDACA